MGKSLIQIFPAYFVIVNQPDGDRHAVGVFISSREGTGQIRPESSSGPQQSGFAFLRWANVV
jgi:hypothetical protein